MSRIATRAYLQGDPLPAVGSKCIVAGANSDIHSDQDRAYSERFVIGYSPDKKLICLQTEKGWPTVERLSNCWFGTIETPEGADAITALQAQVASERLRGFEAGREAAFLEAEDCYARDRWHWMPGPFQPAWDWCKANAKGKWHDEIDAAAFAFEKRSDWEAFKLAFPKTLHPAEERTHEG